MTPEDRTAFVQMLTAGAALYSRDLERPQIELWWKLCQGLTLATWLRAFDQAMKEATHGMPKPADVLRAARTGRPERDGIPRVEGPRANPDHARDSFAPIHEILRTKMPPKERLTWFVQMARKYPGKGWENAVRDTQETVVAQERAQAAQLKNQSGGC
jgi:hypothetical protein